VEDQPQSLHVFDCEFFVKVVVHVLDEEETLLYVVAVRVSAFKFLKFIKNARKYVALNIFKILRLQKFWDLLINDLHVSLEVSHHHIDQSVLLVDLSNHILDY
jgi:hypothetical protein